MNKEPEVMKYQADERLKAFFDKLLDLKKFVLEEAQKSNHPRIKEIYNRLDTIFKESENV